MEESESNNWDNWATSLSKTETKIDLTKDIGVNKMEPKIDLTKDDMDVTEESSKDDRKPDIKSEHVEEMKLTRDVNQQIKTESHEDIVMGQREDSKANAPPAGEDE